MPQQSSDGTSDSDSGKICSRCKRFKTPGEFYGRKDRPKGLRSECKECSNAAHSSYVRENSERMLQHQREYLRRNPQKVRDRNLRAKWGRTQAEYDELLAKQGGGCAACGSKIPGGRGAFHFDHDHTCCPGQKSCGECIRGLLCSGCNVSLGHLEENPERIRRLADYIEKARVNRG